MFFADRLHAEPEDRNIYSGDTNIRIAVTGSMRSLRIEMRMYLNVKFPAIDRLHAEPEDRN